MSVVVPTGRVKRLAKTAGAASVVSAGALLGRTPERGFGLVARTLGELRGVPAKAGQLVGYVEGLAPEGQKAALQSALVPLQTQAAVSPPGLVRAVVEGELGAPIEDLFASWDDSPFASASIGQVHRARLHDGRLVAVKVQHPGIERAVRDDLDNAKLVEALVSRLGPPALNAKELLEELAARLREELDYCAEARQIELFAASYAEDATIQLPRVIADRSARRVLTTVYCSGESFSQALGHGVHLREFYAETLLKFFVKSTLAVGAFNADPHPGNYLFCRDSKVVFLDFGCVQTLSSERSAGLSELYRAAVLRDGSRFERAVNAYFATRGGRFEAGMQRFMNQVFAPIFADRFAFEPAYVRGLTSALAHFRQVMSVRDGSLTPLPRELILLNRVFFGLYSVLSGLRVELDYGAVVARVLDDLET